MIKNIFFYVFIPIFSLFLMNSCGPAKKTNMIGVYYKKTNVYNETEILKNLTSMAFKNNFTILYEKYDKKPKYSVIKKFYRKGVKIIILEDYSGSEFKKFAAYTKKEDILLGVITDKCMPDIPLMAITDFEGLGNDMIHDLYNYSRSQRNTFIMMYKAGYTNDFRKNELIKGYNRFITKYNNFILLTNTYQNTNSIEFQARLLMLMGQFSNNLRGILMDSDDLAVKMAYFLRKIRREDELKFAGFNASLNAIDSITKSGVVVTGDINRYGLFNSAMSNCLDHFDRIMISNKYMTNMIPGVFYDQYNAMDQLALTKKYSIKQIIKIRN